MKIKKDNDEIDILELIRAIINNKLKVLLIIILSISLGYIYSFTQKPLYQVQTEIRPISSVDEFKYQTYNSYIKKKSLSLDSEKVEVNLSFLNNFDVIEKDFLMSLFIDRLIEKESLNNIIKESNFLNKENYQNSKDYDNAINAISSAIKVNLPEDGRTTYWIIKHITSDPEEWKNFMIFTEDFVNNEIREYLEKKFNNTLQTEKKLKEFQIADLEIEIKNLSQINQSQSNQDTYIEQLNELERAKRMLVANLTANKDIDRTQIIFNTTPIVNSDDFYSARIIYKSSKIENINRVNKLAVIMLTGLIGIVISLLYVYILMSLRKSE